MAQKEFLARLEQALNEINPDQREIFLLRNIHGLKFNEIAETLSLSENTVKSRMRYALDSLKRQLSDFVPQLESSTSLTALAKEEQR
jgi:RNA polymerase sigma-70 factor (ECF subfamily)